MQEFIAKNTESIYKTLRELCAIPAPSHHEGARAAYCKQWLENAGATGVYIDGAQNVIFPIGCEGSDEITVFVAHTDTVFPDTEPMPYVDDGTLIRSPGVGDDTASLTILLHVAKCFVEENIRPAGGVLFVCNSCEEGLGNLKGTRQLFCDFAGRISRFISFDSYFDKIADTCVGSHRYEVTVTTEGGHSFLAFGKESAIAALSRMVCDIYEIEVPRVDGSRTTYNVGEITGGTSVNTIAGRASMLCEYRSDNEDCLAVMQAHFERIFEAARARGVALSVKRIGERPCMGKVDRAEVARLTSVCRDIIEKTAGVTASSSSSSTDCNIPLSLGVPAICIGVYRGGGMHTREEWVEKASLPVGLSIGIQVALALTEKE